LHSSLLYNSLFFLGIIPALFKLNPIFKESIPKCRDTFLYIIEYLILFFALYTGNIKPHICAYFFNHIFLIWHTKLYKIEIKYNNNEQNIAYKFTSSANVKLEGNSLIRGNRGFPYALISGPRIFKNSNTFLINHIKLIKVMFFKQLPA